MEHKVFTREGVHLIMSKDIPLVNALTGFSFNLTHLDGHVLHISSNPGDILKNGDLREIPEGGMPVFGSPFTKGNLYIKFNVVFPQKLTKAQITSVKKVLPDDKSEKKPGGEFEECNLEPVDVDRMKRSYASANNAYDESSEEEGGGNGGVSCQQQ